MSSEDRGDFQRLGSPKERLGSPTDESGEKAPENALQTESHASERAQHKRRLKLSDAERIAQHRMAANLAAGYVPPMSSEQRSERTVQDQDGVAQGDEQSDLAKHPAYDNPALIASDTSDTNWQDGQNPHQQHPEFGQSIFQNATAPGNWPASQSDEQQFSTTSHQADSAETPDHLMSPAPAQIVAAPQSIVTASQNRTIPGQHVPGQHNIALHPPVPPLAGVDARTDRQDYQTPATGPFARNFRAPQMAPQVAATSVGLSIRETNTNNPVAVPISRAQSLYEVLNQTRRNARPMRRPNPVAIASDNPVVPVEDAEENSASASKPVAQEVQDAINAIMQSLPQGAQVERTDELERAEALRRVRQLRAQLVGLQNKISKMTEPEPAVDTPNMDVANTDFAQAPQPMPVDPNNPSRLAARAPIRPSTLTRGQPQPFPANEHGHVMQQPMTAMGRPYGAPQQQQPVGEVRRPQQPQQPAPHHQANHLARAPQPPFRTQNQPFAPAPQGGQDYASLAPTQPFAPRARENQIPRLPEQAAQQPHPQGWTPAQQQQVPHAPNRMQAPPIPELPLLPQRGGELPQPTDLSQLGFRHQTGRPNRSVMQDRWPLDEHGQDQAVGETTSLAIAGGSEFDDDLPQGIVPNNQETYSQTSNWSGGTLLGLVGGMVLAGTVGGAVLYFTENEGLLNNTFGGLEVASVDGKVQNRLPVSQQPDKKTIPIAPAPQQAAKIVPPSAVAPIETKVAPAKEQNYRAKLAVRNAGGQAKDAIKLAFNIQDQNPTAPTVVRIKGVPQGAALTSGFDVGSGTWLVPRAQVDNLKIKMPANYAGKLDLVAQVLASDAVTPVSVAQQFSVSVGDKALAEAGMTEPKATQTASAKQPEFLTSTVDQTVPTAARTATVEDKKTGEQKTDKPVATKTPTTEDTVAMLNKATTPIAKLMQKGDAELKLRNVAHARKYYEKAAALGSPDAALALGRTYDPVYFEEHKIDMRSANTKQALIWYQEALSRGNETGRLMVDRLLKWVQKQP